jgi:hypothetical protein
VNLSDLLSLGFILCYFTIKIKGASGGWICVLTILEKNSHAIIKPLHFVKLFLPKVFIYISPDKGRKNAEIHS